MVSKPAETVAPDVMADLQAVIAAATSGKPLDCAVARRIAERSARMHAEDVAKFGVQEIGASIIREMRDAE